MPSQETADGAAEIVLAALRAMLMGGADVFGSPKIRSGKMRTCRLLQPSVQLPRGEGRLVKREPPLWMKSASALGWLAAAALKKGALKSGAPSTPLSFAVTGNQTPPGGSHAPSRRCQSLESLSRASTSM